VIPEKVFQQILALGDSWRVERVDYVEKESTVVIRIQETSALWASEICPHCNAKSVVGSVNEIVIGQASVDQGRSFPGAQAFAALGSAVSCSPSVDQRL